MTASAAGVAGFTTFLFASKDKFRLVDKLGKHITYSQAKGDKYKYFL